MLVLILTTDVPNILEIFTHGVVDSDVKDTIRRWTRKQGLLGHDERLYYIRSQESIIENAGLVLQKTSFGWDLQRYTESTTSGFLWTTPQLTSEHLADVRLIEVNDGELCDQLQTLTENIEELKTSQNEKQLRIDELEACIDELNETVRCLISETVNKKACHEKETHQHELNIQTYKNMIECKDRELKDHRLDYDVLDDALFHTEKKYKDLQKIHKAEVRNKKEIEDELARAYQELENVCEDFDNFRKSTSNELKDLHLDRESKQAETEALQEAVSKETKMAVYWREVSERLGESVKEKLVILFDLQAQLEEKEELIADLKTENLNQHDELIAEGENRKALLSRLIDMLTEIIPKASPPPSLDNIEKMMEWVYETLKLGVYNYYESAYYLQLESQVEETQKNLDTMRSHEQACIAKAYKWFNSYPTLTDNVSDRLNDSLNMSEWFDLMHENMSSLFTTLEEQKVSFEEKIQALQRHLEERNNGYACLEEGISSVCQENLELAFNLQVKRDEYSALAREKENLCKEIEEIKALRKLERETLEAEKEDLRRENSRLNLESYFKSEDQNLINKLTDEVNKLRERNGQLETQKWDWVFEPEPPFQSYVPNDETRMLEEYLNQANDMIEDLTEKKQELEKNLLGMADEIVDLRESNNRKNEIIEELHNKLKSHSTQTVESKPPSSKAWYDVVETGKPSPSPWYEDVVKGEISSLVSKLRAAEKELQDEYLHSSLTNNKAHLEWTISDCKRKLNQFYEDVKAIFGPEYISDFPVVDYYNGQSAQFANDMQPKPTDFSFFSF